MKLGSIDIATTANRREILTMLLWGKSGCGKTVLAATAPGPKLFLQFDPGGTSSLKRSNDVFVADFSGLEPRRIAELKQGGIIERDLTKQINDAGIRTVIIDSITSLGQLALAYAIQSGKANVGKFVATIEQPGLQGYGVRSAVLLDICAMILRVCADTKAHCIFIAHDKETLTDGGTVSEITVSLGGQGQTAVPAKINEIWHMEDTGRERLIYVRSFGVKRPMRTRMFALADKQNRFTFKYDMQTDIGDNLETWINSWQANGYEGIKLPE